MAKFVIGGVKHEFPPLNLKAMRRIWPLIEKVQAASDLPSIMDVTTQIISLVMERSASPMTPEEIEDAMFAYEIEGVRQAMEELLIESGVLQRVTPGDASGEAVGEAASPSTETSTELSPN